MLGGTFNPPHLGHVVLAVEARWRLGLDRVVLVPAGVPPHKEVPADPGAEVRLALCEAAAEGRQGLSVSRIELDRPGPSWTADTLRALHETEPEQALTLIVGGDMAHGLPTWREPEAILRLARLGVAERAGARRADIAERLDALGGAGRVDFLDMPRIDLSSSEVRRRVRAGEPYDHLVPSAVARLVAERGLYQQAVHA